MLGNRQSTARRTTFWILGLGLVLGALVHGLVSNDAGSAWAQPADPRTAFEQAAEEFSRGEFRSARDRLQELDTAPTGVDPRHFVWLRAASQLRQARFENADPAAVTAARQDLEGLLVDPTIDEWSARAYATLLRTGHAGTGANRARDVRAYWERRTDIDAALPGYIDLIEAILDARGGRHASGELRSMWTNVVDAGPVSDVLEDLGVRLLGSDPAVPRFRVRAWGGDDDLVAMVTRDLIARAEDPWVIAVASQVAGQLAERRGDYVGAVAHYQRAIDAVDTADTRFASEAAEALANIRDPRTDLRVARVLRPGSSQRFALSWRNLSAWSLTVRRVDLEKDLRAVDALGRDDDFESWIVPDTGEVVWTLNEADARERAAREDGPAAAGRHTPRSDDRWLDELAPGVYAAEFVGEAFDGESDPTPSRVIFVVSAYGVFERAFHDASRDAALRELWIVDMRDGTPQSGVDLFVARGVYGPVRSSRVDWTTGTHRSGDDGRILLPVLDPVAGRMLLHGTIDGHPIVFDASIGGGPSIARETMFPGLLWTDRPLYRPGETVRLQAIRRTFDPRTRDFSVPVGESVRFEIFGARGDVVHEGEAVLDDNGSIETSWRVPADAALGTYRIQLHDGERRWGASGSFRVDEVRLPEFTVSIDLDDERRFVVGDTLEVVVDAAYLFGGPVRGEATVRVERRVEVPIWPMPWRMPWLESGGGRSMPRIWPGHTPGEVVLESTLALDADGRAVLRIPTRDEGEHAPSWRYTVSAQVTDASRRQERGQGSVVVGRTALNAFLRPERHVVAPADRAWIGLRIQDAMERGVAHQGTLTVLRLDDDGPTPVGDARTLRTDDDGDLRFDVTFERTGQYRVHFEGVDPRGHALEADTFVWVADPRTRDIVSRDDGLQLIAAQEEVIGDTARVLLLSDTPGASVLVTTTHALGSTSEVLRLRGTSTLLEIPLDPVHRPVFRIDATRVADFRVHQATVQIASSEPSRLLDVELSFDRDAVLPGARAPLRVRVTDADGNPVQTIFAVAVVDEALLAVAPRPGVDPLQAFTPRTWIAAVAPRSMASRWGGYVFLERDEDGQVRRDELGRGESRGDGEGKLVEMADTMPEAFANAPRVARSMAADMVTQDAGAAEAFVPTSIRSDFRTTALWQVGIATDAEGRAVVDVPFAESLTSWNALAVAVDPQTRLGHGETTVRTRKPVMVRLNHPRVFRAKDAFVVSAVVHNETDDDLDGRVQLEAEGLDGQPSVQPVFVAAGGQTRVDFSVRVPVGLAVPTLIRDDLGRIVGVEPGSIDVQIAVESDVGDDALRRVVEVHPFGTGLHVATTRELGPGRSVLEFDPIRDRLPGSEVVSLTIAPSMLAAALDALPGLAEFPYGCVEQTLSRFVPALAVRAITRRVGVPTDRFDPELDDKVATGLKRIADLQRGDGGWSWWGGDGGVANPYITAHVLLALSEAIDAGVDVDRGMLRRGHDAMRSMLVKVEARPDDLAYALVALRRAQIALSDAPRRDEAMERMARQLLERRNDLTPYARALTATALHLQGDADGAALVLAHLENDVRTNDRLDTAHWGATGFYWWRGHGAVETTSFVLQAMVAIDPDHPRRDAVARWLVTNRRGHLWDSTRSTAHALYALVDHLDGAAELDPDYTLVVRQGGEEILRTQVDDVIDGGGRFALEAAVIDGGPLELEVVGTGRAYVTFEADAFSRAEEIDAGGNVIAVRREVVRLQPQRTLGQGVVDFEVPMRAGDAVESGDRLRVRLRLTLDHDVDFVMVDDPRVAGAEPVESTSGSFGHGGLWGHREVRDGRTVFFFDAVGEGEHVVEYEVVAESPGIYRVGPARASGMYLPDVTANSTNTRIEITAVEDGPAGGR